MLVRLGELCERHARWIVLAWTLGVLSCSARVLTGWRRLVHLCRRAEPLPPAEQAVLERLSDALGIRRAVRLLASPEIAVPATVGWLRPVVLLPVAALGGLTSAELELVLRHELAHVRRHDYLVNLLQTAAETLLFFHPAVWWIGSVIRSERENCCDDLALASGAAPLSYARALTALETLRVLPAPALSALGGSLPQRVRRLLLPNTRRRTGWSAGASLLPILSGLVVALPPSAIALTCKTAGQPEAVEPVAEPVEEIEEIDLETRTGVESDDEGARPPEPEFSVDQLVQMSAVGVTAEYLQEMRALFGELAAEEVIRLKALGVTRDYAASLRGAGYRDLDADAVANARALGLDARYVRDLRAQGLRELGWADLLGLRALDVTPEWIRSMRAAGLRDLSAPEIQALRGLGVDAEYLREMHECGLDGLSVDDLLKLRAAGVTREFLERLEGH
jgi:beta-lactamase regulating signal transducer with metallopeptidase domain